MWQTFLADATGAINDGAEGACGIKKAGGALVRDADGKVVTKGCNYMDLSSVFGNLTNTLIFLVGAIAVIMIIIGGLRYVLSNGDAKGAESAKNTILYSVIGLVVSIAAFAIVNFVVKAF